MDLNDLKKTWAKMPVGKELDETQLHEMLGGRTKSLIERIDRNIKIGFVLLFGFMILVLLDGVFSSYMMKKFESDLIIPKWVVYIDVFSELLIFSTFIYFAIKYTLVKRKCDISCNLKETLKRIIDTLNIYQRLFYFALFAFLVTGIIEFVTGLQQGFDAGLQREGIQFSDIETSKLIIAGVISLVILILFVGGIFLLLHWGFRKLYGNYILKLRDTLFELEEL